MKLNDIWLVPYFYYNELIYKFESFIKRQRLYIKYVYLKVCWKEFLKKVNDFDKVYIYSKNKHLVSGANEWERNVKANPPLSDDKETIMAIIKEFESIPPNVEKYEREMEELRKSLHTKENNIDDIVQVSVFKSEDNLNDIDQLYQDLKYSNLNSVRIVKSPMDKSLKLNDYLKTILPERVWSCTHDGNEIFDCLLTFTEFLDIPKIDYVNSYVIEPNFRECYQFPLKLYKQKGKT